MLLLRVPVAVHRQRESDPAIVVPEAGAPDHVRDFEHAAVRELRHSAVLTGRSLEHALDARGFEVRALHPEERPSVRANRAPCPASDRRGHGQDAGGDQAEHGERDPRGLSFDVDRKLAGVSPREHGPKAGARDLVGDVPAGVRCAHDEHGPLPELLGSTVIGRVQLPDRGVEPDGELRDRGLLEDTGRDHHVLGLESELSGGDAVARFAPLQVLDRDPRSHGQLEAFGVGFQVIGHLGPGGERVPGCRKRHPREGGRGRR